MDDDQKNRACELTGKYVITNILIDLMEVLELNLI